MNNGYSTLDVCLDLPKFEKSPRSGPTDESDESSLESSLETNKELRVNVASQQGRQKTEPVPSCRGIDLIAAYKWLPRLFVWPPQTPAKGPALGAPFDPDS